MGLEPPRCLMAAKASPWMAGGNLYVADYWNDRIRKVHRTEQCQRWREPLIINPPMTLHLAPLLRATSMGLGPPRSFIILKAWQWTPQATSMWRTPQTARSEKLRRTGWSQHWAESQWKFSRKFLLYKDPPQPPVNIGIAEAYQDGIGDNARFYFPYGVAVGPNGTVYVADTDNNLIRQGVEPVVQVVALEVTQVIQDWNNSIPLVDSGETYVRSPLAKAARRFSRSDGFERDALRLWPGRCLPPQIPDQTD